VLVTTLEGQVITGGSMSLTVTVKLQAVVLPFASVAVQVTGVTPLAKLDPLAGTQPNPTPGQLSLITGVKPTTCVQAPGAALVTMLAGHVLDGGC
jgi:hypothetical protein